MRRVPIESNWWIEKISFAQPSTNKAPQASDDYDDIEAVIPATTVRVEPSARDSAKAEGKGSETKSTDTDKKLMPPPSIPLKSQIRLIKIWLFFSFTTWCNKQLLLLKIAVMTLPSRKKIRALVMKEGEKENEVKLIENWRHRWQQCYHPNMPMWMFVNCFPIFGPTKCCDFPDCLAPANQQVYHKSGVAYERNDESESNRVKIGLVCRHFIAKMHNFVVNFLGIKCLAKGWLWFNKRNGRKDRRTK